jgi:hypothetical protein
VAADDGAVFAARQDRLDEAELPDAPLQGIELLVADPPGVGRIRTKFVDRDLLDGEESQGGHADLASAAATHSSRPSIGMRS